MTRIDSPSAPHVPSLSAQAGPAPSAPVPSATPGIPQDVWEVATAAKQQTEQAMAASKGKKKGKAKNIPPPLKGVPQGTPVPSSVPGASFAVSKNGFPVGTTKEVNGMVEIPGLGWVQAPKKTGKKGAVNLQIGKKRLLAITKNKDGSISVKEQKVKGGGFFGSTLGKALGFVLSAASFVFPVLAPVAIGYQVAAAASAIKDGNILGGALQLAGAAAGGVGTFASTAGAAASGLASAAQTASTVGKVAVAGIGAGQAIKNGDFAGAAAGLAGAAAAGANVVGLSPGTTAVINNTAQIVQNGARVADGIRTGDFSTIGAGIGGALQGVNGLTPLPKEVLTAGSLAQNVGTVVDGIRGQNLGEIATGLGGAAKTLGADQSIKNAFGIG